MDDPSARRMVLRDLPTAARVTIAAFLICIGLGYFSGLVQLHFAQAKGGNLLPTTDDASDYYHGATTKPMSRLEKLLTQEDGPFNGSGTMKPAFFAKSEGSEWQDKLNAMKPGERAEFLEKRKGEWLAVLHWARLGAPRDAYEKGKGGELQLPPDLQNQSISEEFLKTDGAEGKPINPKTVLIKELFEQRCFRCHGGGADNKAANFPLDTYEAIAKYAKVETAQAMSLDKLALTTHVHLIGFGMMFGLTGIIFAFTSYPCLVRTIFGPFTLIAQVVDISFWWLGRLDPFYAKAIVVTGTLVAGGLAVQILGSLFNMFGKKGRIVLVVLMAIGVTLAVIAKVQVVDPHLNQKAADAAAAANK